MTIPAAQREVADFLAGLAGGAPPIETHISAVFVGAGQALKLKKAVALAFLDFTTVEARHRFCRRELDLNRPAAPEIYRDVLPVTRAPSGALALGGDPDAALDWVLRMAPVPAADFLDAVAARGALTPALLDATADAVAAMHAEAPVAHDSNPVHGLRAAEAGNRAAALAAGLPADRIDAWSTAAEGWIARLAPCLTARAAAGRIRRCHGDLHLGNLLLWRGRPTPFDALEFDEAIATIDTGYDLAFLLMDLDVQRDRAAANRILNRYVARTGDAGLAASLPPWLSLRALIRAHCEAGSGRPWHAYLAVAEAYLRPPPPQVVAIGGLQGTGKSTLARALAPALGAAPGALVLRTDEIRKRRFGLPPEAPLPPAAYAEPVSLAVHADLFAALEEAARAGHAVIADATFLDPAHRAAAEAAAARAGVPFQGFWLDAPLDALRARLRARSGDASDADVAVLEAASRADPGPFAPSWRRLDAARDPLPAVRAALAPTVPPSC